MLLRRESEKQTVTRRNFDKLTIKEARELVMAAIEVAEAMVVEKYGSPQGNSKRYENACRALTAAATQADARMLDEAMERVAREDHDAEVRLRGEPWITELEKDASKR